MSPRISVRSWVHICISKLLHNILFAWEYSNSLNEVKILQLYYLRLCNKFGHFYHIAYIFRAIGKKEKKNWRVPSALAAHAHCVTGDRAGPPAKLWRVPRVADGKIKKNWEDKDSNPVIGTRGAHLSLVTTFTFQGELWIWILETAFLLFRRERVSDLML